VPESDFAKEGGWDDDDLDDIETEVKEVPECDFAKEGGWDNDDLDDIATEVKEVPESDFAKEGGWADDDIDVEVDESSTEISNDNDEKEKVQNGWANEDDLEVDIDADTDSPSSNEKPINSISLRPSSSPADGQMEQETTPPTNEEGSSLRPSHSVPRQKPQNVDQGSSECADQANVWSNAEPSPPATSMNTQSNIDYTKLLEEEKQKRENIERQLESYKMAAAFATRNSNDLRSQYESVQSALVSVEDEFRVFRENASRGDKVAISRNDELIIQMKALSEDLVRAKEEANEYKEKTAHLFNDSRGFMRTLQSKDNELNKLQRDIETSRNQTFACEEEIIELKERIERITVDKSNDSGLLLSVQSDLAKQQQCSRDLESRVSDLQAELNSSRDLEHQLRDQITKLQKDSESISSLKAENLDLQKKLKESEVNMTSSSNQSRSQLAAAQIEVIELKSKLKDSERSLANVSADKVSASKNFANMESQVRQLKQNLVVAESASSLQSDEFTKKLAMKLKELNERNQEIAHLKARNETLSKELSEQSEEIVAKGSIEMQRALLAKERDELLSRNIELEGKIVACEEKSKSLSLKVDEFNLRSRDEGALTSELRQQVDRLRNENDQLFSDNEDILIELGYQKQLQDTQREEFAVANARLEERLKNEIENRAREKESATEVESSLRSDLTKYVEENKLLKCEVEELSAERKRDSAEKAQCNGAPDQGYTAKIEKLRISTQEKQNTISLLEDRLRMSECGLEEKDIEIKDALTKLEGLTSSISEQKCKDDDVSQLKAESQGLRQSLDSTKRELQVKELEIAALNERLDADRKKTELPSRDVFSSPFLKGLRSDNISPDLLKNQVLINLISALERSELQRADCLDRLVSERMNHAESLKKLGDSVKRFYSTLSYGDSAS